MFGHGGPGGAPGGFGGPGGPGGHGGPGGFGGHHGGPGPGFGGPHGGYGPGPHGGHHGGPRGFGPNGPYSPNGNPNSASSTASSSSQPGDEIGFFHGLILTIRGHNIYDPTTKSANSQEAPMSNQPTFRKPNFTPTPYHRAIMRIATTLSIILGCCMVLSNVLGIKIIGFGPIMLDGGIFFFPITYIVGDVMVMLFDKEITESVTKVICGVAVVFTLALMLCNVIPNPPGVNNPSMDSAFGMSAQICFGSIIAFFVSRKANNTSLRKRLAQGKSKFWSTFWSSVWGHLWDSALFTFIAFWGRHYGFATLALQAFSSLTIAVIIEFALNGTKLWLYKRLNRYLKKVAARQQFST